MTSLGIVSVHPHDHITCNSIDVNLADGNEFIKAFPTVFNGLGNIKGDPIHIELEEHSIPYHVSAPRHIALPLLEPLKQELQ